MLWYNCYIHNVTSTRMITKGMIVMFFVNKKVEKINKNRKSLISRNRGFKTELKKSVRLKTKLKTTT